MCKPKTHGHGLSLICFFKFKYHYLLTAKLCNDCRVCLKTLATDSIWNLAKHILSHNMVVSSVQRVTAENIVHECLWLSYVTRLSLKWRTFRKRKQQSVSPLVWLHTIIPTPLTQIHISTTSAYVLPQYICFCLVGLVCACLYIKEVKKK